MEEEFIFETDIPKEILDSFTNIKLVRGGMFKKFAKKFATLFKTSEEKERQEEEAERQEEEAERQRQEERKQQKEEAKRQEEENIKKIENNIINYKNKFYTNKKFKINPEVKIIINQFTKKSRNISEYIEPKDISILPNDIYYLMFFKLFKEFTLISEIDKYLINYKKKSIEKIKNSTKKIVKKTKKKIYNTIKRKTSINIGLEEEKEINIIQKIRKFNNNIIQIQNKIKEIYKKKTGKDKQETPLYSLPLLFFIKEAYKTIRTPKDIKERLQQKYKEYIEKQEEEEKQRREEAERQRREEEKKEKNKYFTNLENSMDIFYENPEINHFIQLKNDIDFISVKYKNTEKLKDYSKQFYTFIKYCFILDTDTGNGKKKIYISDIYNRILLSKENIINKKIESINKYLEEDNKIEKLVIPSNKEKERKKKEKERKKKEKVSQINLNNFLKGKNNNKEEEFNNSKEEEEAELETLKKKLKKYKKNKDFKDLVEEIELYIKTYENEITGYTEEIEEFKKENIDIFII